MMDNFQARTKSSKDISSIADMQAFVESYPEFRKLSGDVTKHVTLLGEINRLVDALSLMEVSQVEQELACTEDHSTAVSEVESLLRKPSIQLANKIRLVLLYALRYEREPANRIEKLTELLGAAGATAEQQRLVATIRTHYGAAVRTGDLFGNKSMLTVMKKAAMRSVKGVQNVYTQHSPYLVQTLEAVSKGLLSEGTHPYLGPELPAATKKKGPTELIVFVLGGTTYEEAKAVGEMNAANPGVRIILGGTTVHSGDSFVAELARLSGSSAAGLMTGGGGGGAPGTSTWDVASSLASIAPPNVDRKRIAALTSSVSSTVSQGVNSAMSKLQ